MNTTPESLPVVTILIATFNSEKILPRTLEGIKKQSYPQDKLDLLAVDGGSTDGTYALIERYGGSSTIPEPSLCTLNCWACRPPGGAMC